ncbi:MAG TPA: DUF4190 domain-containing protein [Pyrinomonadaceae bacterium]|jgi:hypothetical protein|nr:DUF4190 domain-containing protein [Pyrinomonadaceae bacterium]
MKRCPKCGQTYNEVDINFCLNDGELLAYMPDAASARPRDDRFADDAPPTLTMDSPRVTNQSGWQAAPPLAHWQNPTPAAGTQPFGLSAYNTSKDQTLPTISLVLGIISCFLVCCAGGIWLGLPAAVVGYLGMRNADNDPGRYSGRGLAIAGMVIGIVTFLASFVFLIIGSAR